MNKLIKLFGVYIFLLLTIFFLSTCSNPFSAGLGEKVDLEAPQLEITSHYNGDAVGSVFDLSGSIIDDGLVKSVTISLNTEANVIGTATINNSNWSYNYDSNGLTDGDYNFLVVAVDDTDKSVSRKVLLTVDNNPPSVLVTSPSGYGIAAEDPEFNKSITIKGEAADTTRVKEVRLYVYKELDDTLLLDDSTFPGINTNNIATGTSSWYFILDASSILIPANYYINVVAEDYSGNKNTYFYHFKDLLDLAVDKGNIPNIEEINANDYQAELIPVGPAGIIDPDLTTIEKTFGIGSRMIIKIDPASDQPQFTIINPAEGSILPSENIFSSPQRLSGFVEDDDLAGIDENTLTLTIYEWGTSNVIGTPAVYGVDPNLTLSGNTWTYESSLVDGEYGVQLTVIDIGGNAGTSSEVPFKVSSFAPVVSLNNPQQGVYIGKGSTTTVQVTVIGASGDEVFIDLNDNGTYEDPGEKMNILGGGVYNFDIIEPTNLTGLVNGDNIFQIRAGVNPNFGTTTLQYTGDIDDPTVAITYPPDSANVNGIINISGTTSDNYLIDKVYVWISTETDWTLLPTDYTVNPGWVEPTGTYNWTLSNFDTNTLTDNTSYTIFVKSFDAAGNESDLSLAESSLNFTVNQESDRPEISLSNMIEGGSSNGLAQDASIIGLIEDDDLVDASSMEVRVDIYNDGLFPGVDLTGSNGTLDANETEQWIPIIPGATSGDDVRILSWAHNLLNVPQGVHSMQIRVHDTISDGVTFNEGTNPNYAELIITEFIIDYGPPDLVITSPSSGSIFNADFPIEGTATDPNKVTDVDISFDAGTTYQSLYSDPTGSGVVNWTHNFTVDPAGADDGDYSYLIQATDISGGKTTLNRQVVVDATDPTVMIELPGAGSTVNGDSITIRGTANDNAQVSKVYLAEGTTLPAAPAGNDPAADIAYTELGSTYNWSYNLDSALINNTDSDQSYFISIVAVDGAGNLSIKENLNFTINQGSDRPVISFNDIDKDETVAANNVLVGATNLTGIIEDDDLIDPALFGGASIEINIDNSGWIPVSNPPASSGKVVVWKHDISALIEGAHTVSLRARDNQSDNTVGADSGTVEYTSNFNWGIEDAADQSGVPFILNIGPPSITIDEPLNYSSHNTDVVISGDATDANGVQDVFVSTDNGITWIDLNITPSLPNVPAPWSHTHPAASGDGTYSYMVRAIDAYGSTGIENGQFTVDATLPTITTMYPSSGESVNGSITIWGTAEDNITVSDVYINLNPSSVLEATITFPDDYTHLTGTYSWNHTFDTTAIVNEAYTLRVAAVDGAGNRSLFTDTINRVAFNIDQESDRPTLDITSIGETDDFMDNDLGTTKQIGGIVQDDDNVDVDKIWYKLFQEDGTTVITDWTPVNGAPATDRRYASWTQTFGAEITDGKYQVMLRAADTNDAGTWTPGGYGWVETSLIKFTYDSTNPSVVVTSPVSNGGYTNANLTINGTAGDNGGLKSIDIQFNGGAWTNLFTGDGSSVSEIWTRTFTVDTTNNTNDGLLNYIVSATDSFNKTTTVDRYIYIDTQIPEPTINIPSTGEIVNGMKTFRGEASDIEANSYTGVQKEIWIYVGLSALTPTYPDDYTLLSGVYSWEYDFDTVIDPVTFIPDGNYTLHVIAKDSAGNSSADTTIGFVVNQSSDQPVLSVTQPTNSGLIESNKKVIGSLSDDDGLTSLQIQIDRNNDGDFDDANENYVNIDTPATVSGVNINFEHDLSGLSDGSYKIRLQAVDNINASTNDTTTSSIISFDIDTAAPTLTLDQITVQNRYGGADTVIAAGFNGSYINNDSTLTFSASDSSGVASVEVSVDGGSNWTTDNSAPYSYSLSVSGLSEGTNNITYRATDNHGKTTSKILTIIVDTAEPTIDFSNPTGVTTAVGDDAPNVNGDVNIRGSVSDSSSISSTTLVGGVDTAGNPVTLINTGNTISWISQIANSGTYANAAYAIDQTGNIWRFPFEVTTEDLAGNITTTTGYVDIDPDSDSPLVSVISPSNDASVSGTFLVNGTITDDDGTDYVTLEFDFDDDGAFDDAGDALPAADLTLSNDLTIYGLPDSTINESTPVPLPAPNGSWSIALNASDFTLGKLATAGYTGNGFLSLRVVPFDINGLQGAEQISRIYLDTTSPVIAGLDIDGTTEIADPTPATSTLQKGTITLRTRFEDDKELLESSMLISLDGGATFNSINSAYITDQGTTNPYKYYIEIPIDTTSIDNPVSALTGGNGLLSIQLSITDQTNKQNSKSITYSVDNNLPTIHWNEDNLGTLLDLPFIGTPPNEIYNFKGNESTGDGDDAYKVLGAAIDLGTISGIDKINIYYVKGGFFYSPINGANTAVSNSNIADDTGTPVSIPFTENSSYIITIDNRIEQGLFDQTGGIGDFDGFEESLKAKAGYDEWYSFFDTTQLPDGPLEIYAVAYDEAGNMSYTVADAQIANNPPTIPTVVVGSTTINDTTDKTKNAGTVDFTINLADAEGIDVSTIQLYITDRYTIVSGLPDTVDGTYTPPAALTSVNFDSITPGTSSTAEVVVESVDTTAFTSGYYYRYVAEANDSDGNIVQQIFYVWVNNSDSSAPTVTIDDFSQTSVFSVNGHVEEEVSSLNDAADTDTLVDADLSGTVTVSGTAYDDSSVSTLSVEFSLDNGSTWTDAGTASVVTVGGDVISGFDYTWTFDWDTSTIISVAEEDVLIRAYATDGTNTTAAGSRPEKIVDIVPYITEITGTGLDNGLLTYVRRSATGKHPISTDQTITIIGYNLPVGGSNTVTVGTTTTGLSGTGTTNQISVDLTGVSTSGDINIITNGVNSLNNTNNNNLTQNKEANLYNANLTDNREAVFWSSSSLTGTTTVTDPNMQPNALGTGYEWMYVKSGKDLYMNQSGTEKMLTSSTGLSGGAFTYNSSGSLMFLFNNNSQWTFVNNTYAFTGSVQFGQIPSLAGYTYLADQDEAYNWNNGLGFGKLGLGNVSFNNSAGILPAALSYGTPTYDDLDLNRYDNLKIITIGSDTLSRNYAAYFDTGAGESRSIVFMGFQTSDTISTVSATSTVYEHDGLLAEVGLGGGIFANIDKYYETNGDDDTVALAGTATKNDTGIATPRGRQEVTTANSGNDSVQFDLAVYEQTPGSVHFGFIAYFDEAVQSLKITANESLYNADPTGTLGAWISPLTVDTNAGASVAMDIDPDGGIHLAYQDVSTGYLKYAYLTYNAGTDTFTVEEKVFVDALLGAGANNSIIIRDFGGADYRPVISTYSSAFTGTKAPIRLSYPLYGLTDPSFGAGADSSTGAFLGDWETVALPALSNPVNSESFLYIDGSGNAHLGYEGSNLEESIFLGF